jgi:hypothetical protein
MDTERTAWIPREQQGYQDNNRDTMRTAGILEKRGQHDTNGPAKDHVPGSMSLV